MLLNPVRALSSLQLGEQERRSLSRQIISHKICFSWSILGARFFFLKSKFSQREFRFCGKKTRGAGSGVFFFVGWLAVEWNKKPTPTQKVQRKFHGMVLFFGNPEPTSPMGFLKMRWLVGSSSPLNIWAMKKHPGCSFRVPGRARFSSCTPHRKRRFSGILNIVSQGFGNTCVQGPTLSIRTTGSSVFVFVTAVRHV